MRRLYFFLLILLSGTTVMANNVQISNVSIINNGPGNIQVQFDLSWDNSWRVNTGPNNYDGAWVFFKYKTASGNWTHLTMTGSNNVIPSGFDVYQTNDFLKSGAMLFRDATNMGAGSVSMTTVRLGVINTVPYDITLKGFAIEMVYVPPPVARVFYGDGDGATESTNALHYTDNTATTTSVVPMHTDANTLDDGELDADGIYVYSNDTIQTSVPIGTLDPFPTMKAAWCMKYEISQAGYRDFLNTLTVTQQTSRTTPAPASATGTAALGGSPGVNRNFIEIAVPASGAAPAVYGCDANGNDVYDESDDGEWVACNFLMWPDVAAYLDWCGMAPMSELQFEKFCRGVSSAGANPAILGEYAWGNTSVTSVIYTLNNPNQASEVASNADVINGNANYSVSFPFFPDNGPMRNGSFADAGSNRTTSGSGYYGIMELSGNVFEYCICLGNAAGRSVYYIPNGNGTISSNGNGQLSIGGAGFWPGMEGNNSLTTANTCAGTCEVTGTAGIMFRGGSWLSSATSMRIATRTTSLPSLSRTSTTGGRGVLNIR